MKKARKKVIRKLSAAGLAMMAGAAHGQTAVQSAGANAAPATAPAEKATPSFLSMRLRMRMNMIDNAWDAMTRAQFDEHYGAAREILAQLKAARMTVQQQQYALMTEMRLRELDTQFERLHR